MADTTTTQQAPRPSVQQFFAGRSVLVTGSTGFVGKVRKGKKIRPCTLKLFS